MPASILVAYATRYGSTREVAEAVATTLRTAGFEADAMPMRKVRSLQGFQAVVLGAPLYLALLHRDAHQFLMDHRTALTGLPAAVFALGPLSPSAREMQEGRLQLYKELAKYSWLNPQAVEVFNGKYDPARLRPLDRFVAMFPGSPLKQLPLTDARDWDAIHTWAGSLVDKLKLPEE